MACFFATTSFVIPDRSKEFCYKLSNPGQSENIMICICHLHFSDVIDAGN
jgi:hypothetical protein